MTDMTTTEIIKNNEAEITLQKKKYRPKRSYMKAEYSVELHTWQARNLFFGAWEHGRYGLLQFAKMMSSLTKAAEKGDPYAEHFLIETDLLLFKAQESIEDIKNTLDQQLKQVEEINIHIYATENPLPLSLQFVSPLGFVAIRLLKKVDTIIRIALTLKQLGIFLKKDQYDYSKIHRMLLEIFEFPSHWQQIQVTRKDILENTPIAEKAKTMMGELPEAILNREIQAPFLKSHAEIISQSIPPWG